MQNIFISIIYVKIQKNNKSHKYNDYRNLFLKKTTKKQNKANKVNRNWIFTIPVAFVHY